MLPKSYVIEESAIDMGSSPLNKLYDLNAPGFLKSVWLHFNSILTAPLEVQIAVKNHLGNLKEVVTETIPTGKDDYLLYYESTWGYPIVKHSIGSTGYAVTKDKLSIKTDNAQAGLTVDAEMILYN